MEGSEGVREEEREGGRERKCHYDHFTSPLQRYREAEGG